VVFAIFFERFGLRPPAFMSRP